MPNVRVLRPFNNGTHHSFVEPGDVIAVTDERAAELIRVGLVEASAGEKAAPVVQNKAAPVVANKAITAAPARRAPGRSAKIG